MPPAPVRARVQNGVCPKRSTFSRGRARAHACEHIARLHSERVPGLVPAPRPFPKPRLKCE
eukprot:758865-Pleurochrysis_carterae.AAC.1